MAQGVNPRIAATVVIEKSELQQIFSNLSSRGFVILGPRLERGAVVIGPRTSMAELAIGLTSEHGPGHYRVSGTGRVEHFAALPANPTWRDFIFPPHSPLITGHKTDKGWVFENAADDPPPYAFVGIRSCELAALGIYDHVFLTDGIHEASYAKRREPLFVLAVNCTSAANTCFCTSMKTGPRAVQGFDLALTELNDLFLLECGSEIGSEMLADVKWRPASAWDIGRARELEEHTEEQITRRFDSKEIADALMAALDSTEWDALGAKCLGCGNCTSVCPTCFCSTVEDRSDLKCLNTSRERRWDSCYAGDYSHVAGGNVRPTTASRHRQWVMHKFALSEEQVGRPACVGCGRCITWCPVGIDITEEVCAIRAHASK